LQAPIHSEVQSLRRLLGLILGQGIATTLECGGEVRSEQARLLGYENTLM
jgi:hypothetical protein